MPKCNEYKNLRARGFRDYSVGHQKMYSTPIHILRLEGRSKPLKLLDVGSGIGWGLERMLEARIVGEYVGVEPNSDSYHYCFEQFRTKQNVQFRNEEWLECELADYVADYTFCIEVVEHLPEDSLRLFLEKLRRHTRHNLFLSTPDCSRSKHGKKTKEEWKSLLVEAQFTAVSIDRQWTCLFICQ